MKYVNSLKYMNGFPLAETTGGLSQRRALELCTRLGRVNVGNETNTVFVPGGTAGHAAAVMLESVIKSAGYRVGRITSAYGPELRSMVCLDGEYARIEDYNRAVTELKSVIPDGEQTGFFRWEASFAAALLICKLYACKYIILEGMSDEGCDLAALCAPYDMVIIPPVYNEGDQSVRLSCDAVRHGVREVISGNQKRAAYDLISDACVASGARLTLTSKTGFKTEECSSIKLGFSYGDRGGYSLKSPSVIQRECAMLVIESALAVRRDGVKMPWTAISLGLACASGTGCFETVSVSPLVIFDSSESMGEAALLESALTDVFGVGKITDITIFLPSESYRLSSVFADRGIAGLVTVGEPVELTEKELDIELLNCKNCKTAAKELFKIMKNGKDVICFGSVAFSEELKTELLKLMNG